MTNYSGRLLLNKMQPRRRSGSLISRTTLLTNLNQHRASHVTAVHAPAGYGKTTLLTQYFDQLTASDKNCGWLTLDSADDDPVQFLAYIISSLTSTQAISNDILEAALSGFPGLSENEATRLVFNSLLGIKDPTYIFLDNYHCLPTEKSQQLAKKLIEQTSDNSRFIISSRELPVDLKGRMQVYGAYHELAATDLAFTLEETCRLFASPNQQPVAVSLIEKLHEKSEGWVAAIEFSRIWLGKTTEFEINNFINQSVDFTTYLMAEIFSQLSVSLQEVMLKISVVSEFDGDLINALCARNDGWHVLNELFQRDLIIPLDASDSSYRIHNLLANFLLTKLQREHSTEITDLHCLLTKWYMNKTNARAALRHALASNDADLIASVAENSGGWHYILDGRISTLINLLKHVPLEILKNYPSTYLGHLVLQAKFGQPTKAVREFREYSVLTNKFTSLNDSFLSPSFSIEASTVDFFLAALEDRPQTLQHVNRIELVLKSVDKENHFLQATILNFLTFALFDSGGFERAFKAGEDAIFHYKELHSIYGENYLYFHLGKICLAQGRLRDAERLYSEGHQLAIDHFGKDSDLVAIASAHLAEVAYEKNDFIAAQAYLKIALPRIEHSEAWFDVYFSAYIAASNIARIMQTNKAAIKFLNRASVIAKRRNMQRLRLMSICQKIRLLIQAGKLEKAKWIINRLQLDTFIENATNNEIVSYRMIEEVSSVIAYYLVQIEQADKASKIIDRLLAAAKSRNGRRSIISANILASLAYFKRGKLKQSMARLNEAVSHALFEGFKRPFLEFKTDQRAILELALSDNKLFPINRLKRSFLLDLIHLIKQESKSRNNSSSSILTLRECEIVKYVCDGNSNKEIARNCNCSENTVKFHLKNIFAKLGIKSRKSLATIAWQQDL